MPKTQIIVRRKKKDKTAPPVKKSKRYSPEELVAIRAKHEAALNLRMTGATFKDIAGALGYSNPGSAKRAVEKAIDRTQVFAAKHVVQLDLYRLDEYQMRCTNALRNNGDLGQIDRLMRIMDMRYRLLGIEEETLRNIQGEQGIVRNGTTNNVMVVNAAPMEESSEEFLGKMMRAVGISPESDEAKKYLENRLGKEQAPLPINSVGDAKAQALIKAATALPEEDIVDAEIVE